MVAVAWAGATPLGASPDEPAHIIRAASVVRGEVLGENTDEAAVTRVHVPAGIAMAHSWPCYAFHPQVTAACAPGTIDGGAMTSATTTAGLYNPTYYALVGWTSLVTDDTSRSVMMMRVVSATLVSFFMAIALSALIRLRPALITGLGFITAATPMYVFLAGAVNPNALEVSAGAALAASLLLIARRFGTIRIRIWLSAVAASGLLLAQSRGLSPLWMALIASAAVLSSPRATLAALVRRWEVQATVVVLAGATVAAVLWSVVTGTLTSMGAFPGAGQVSPIAAFATTLIGRTIDGGLVGVFGWLDTPAPPFVFAWWAFLSMALGVAALILGRGRMLAGFLVALGGFVLIPPIVQGIAIQSSGFIWQGRYALIGFAAAVIWAAAALGDRLDRQPWSSCDARRLVIVVGSITVLAHLSAFIAALKRYSVGLDGSWPQFVRDPLWEPPFGASLWTLLLALGLAAMVFYWYRATRAEIMVTVPAPSGRG
jgi:hypothetical protein